MERNANDFDQVVMTELFGKQEEKPFNENDIKLGYYDPLTPIMNRLKMKPVDEPDDYFGDTPAFI